MDIKELCSNQREVLVERWVNRFFATYPLDSKGFMRTNRDRFTNPVGETTRIAAAVLYDAVIGMDADPETVKTACAVAFGKVFDVDGFDTFFQNFDIILGTAVDAAVGKVKVDPHLFGFELIQIEFPFHG